VGRLLLGVLVATASLSIAWGNLEGQTKSALDPARADESTVVPGQYIVVFHESEPDPLGLANQIAVKHGGSVRQTYQHAIKGCAMNLSQSAVDLLKLNPNVAYIEPDRRAQIYGTQNNPPSWGLDRVDQTDLPLNSEFVYGNEATGLDVYVLDSGVRFGHSDFSGRIQFVPNGSNGDFVGDGNGSAEDCYGHGTHVAGIIAGSSHGVSKDATIWAARVTDCDGNGTASMALAAVDWITANAQLPSVVNMSLGYPNTQALTDAVENSIAAGFVYVVAAGNSVVPMDACFISPANANGTITVGSTDIDDVESGFSNFGDCVDVLAPGRGIVSTAMSGDSNASETRSGTSQAAPHVAGAAAMYLAQNPGATPYEVKDFLLSTATVGRITLHALSQSGATPNLLLNVTSIGPPGPPPSNAPPIVVDAIPDTTIAINSAPFNYRDLNNVFDDAEDGDSLSFSIISNSDTSLIDITIDPSDSTLGLSIAPADTGSATIVIRALDSELGAVQDTFAVSVVTNLNLPPTVASAMPDTTVYEDSPTIENYRDLNDVFDDPQDGGALSFAVDSNSNSELVNVSIDADSGLDLSFMPDQNGSATIVIRATDAGSLMVNDTLVVTVAPINDPPVVVSAIQDTIVVEDNTTIADYRDLTDVFYDLEDSGTLSFAIHSNSDTTLVSPTINVADSMLELGFGANENGVATIVVRATDSGTLVADDTVVVTVISANDRPVVISAIPDTTLEGGSSAIAYRDLNSVFNDVESGNGLEFEVRSNSNPALLSLVINPTDSTLDIVTTPGQVGAATVVIRARDIGGLWIEDSFNLIVKSNAPPIVVSAVPDTTVAEDNPAIDGYRDLRDVFLDPEEGTVLSFSIQANSDPGLVMPIINPEDSTLDLTFGADQSGSAAIVLRATDSGALFVDDTLLVTVTPVNDVPVIVSAIPDTTVLESNPAIINFRDLNDVFQDVEDGTALTYAVQNNSNPALVSATVGADSTLDLSFGLGQFGSATIVIRATDSGAITVDDTLVVTVTPVNDAPIVVRAMPDTTVSEDSPNVIAYRYLKNVFFDFEDFFALSYAIAGNNNPALVTATIGGADNTLDMAFSANQSGSASIVVRATDSAAQSVDDTLVVTVTPVNDTPVVVLAMPDTTVGENNPPIAFRDLNTVFDDVEDGGALAFTIESNSNPSLLTAMTTTSGGGDLTFQSVSTAGSGGNAVSVDVNAPAGTVAGDLLVASFAADDSTVLSPPDGSWILIEGGDGNPNGATPSFAVWYKIAGSSEPAFYTFTSGANQHLYAVVLRYDGHDPVAPINASAIASSSGSATPTAPSVTTTVNGAKILRLFGADDDDTPYISPGGHAERYNGTSGNGPITTGSAGADIDQATAGPTGTAAFSMNAPEEWQAVTVAIAPASSSGDNLMLTFAPGSSGTANVVVRATDSGAHFAEDAFVVTVGSQNDAPIVSSGIPDTTVVEDNGIIAAYRDLNNVFSDTEDGTALSFAILSNDNPSLITASIDPTDSTLDLDFGVSQNGSATIAVRATDLGGLWADDSFVVTVTPGNQPPRVVSAIPDTTVIEDDPPFAGYRDLNDVFDDPEDGSALAFTITSNSDTAIVLATIDSDSALDLSFGTGQSGAVTIVVRATDMGTLSVEDTFVITVNGTATSVPDPILPERYALHQNVPNPFNPTTFIRFDIGKAGPVMLRVFDVSGRLVRTLIDREMPAAKHEIDWDGRNDEGVAVSSGVYFYRLESSGFHATRKMVMLK